MKLRALALAVLVAGCHSDWQEVLDTCVDAGRCTSGAGGGSGGSGGGSGSGALEWGPPQYTFGPLEPDASVEVVFQLLNTGSLTLGRIGVGLDGGAMFAIASTECGDPLGFNVDCAATVRFAPTATGTFSVELIGRELLDGGARATAMLTGIAKWADVPLILRTDGGAGSGSVSVSAPDASVRVCTSECTFAYPRTTTVTLRASGNQSDFGRWSGSTCSGTDASCTLTLVADAGATVVAAFDPWPRLTVTAPTVFAAGDFHITMRDSGFDCPDAGCSIGLEVGTAFQLDAVGSRYADFVGWVGCASDGGPSCSGTMSTVGVNVTAQFRQYNRVFLTPPLPLNSTLAGFTAHCLSAGNRYVRASDWAPWTYSPGPPDLNSAHGFVRMDGMPFVDDPFNIDNATFYPPIFDVDGHDVGLDAGPIAIATGKTASCTGWTRSNGAVTTGLATAGAGAWDDDGVPGSHDCSESLRILCFQKDHRSSLPTSFPIPDGGRLAFVTGATTAAVAMNGADQLCQGEGPPGHTFVALRAEPGVSAASRLELDGGTWYRLDGVRLMPTASMLASPTPFRLEASLHQRGDGGYLGPALLSAWTGAPSSGAAGNATCGTWMPGGAIGSIGDVTDSSSSWFFAVSTTACNAPYQLYCFER